MGNKHKIFGLLRIEKHNCSTSWTKANIVESRQHNNNKLTNETHE